MEYKFKQGQKLIVELHSWEIFEGTVISCGKHHIVLGDLAENGNSQAEPADSLTFYRSEINDIILHITEQEVNNDSNDGVPNESTSKETSPIKQILVEQCEYDRYTEMTENYIYMATIDKRYIDAVEYLKRCESIGVVTLGSTLENGVSLLVFSAWDQVYIFDIQEYNKKKFPIELKEILEMELPQKIVNDSRNLVSCLKHNYKITVRNIFDTAVAHVTIEKKTNADKQTILDLGQLLSKYLNFPETLLKKAIATSSDKWRKRPFSSSKKRKAAQMATYLHIIKHTLEKLLLSEFIANVKTFTESTGDFLESDKTLSFGNLRLS